MSLGHGGSVVRDGLVLYIDAANTKSYNPNMIEYSEQFNNPYWTNVNGTIFVSTTELAPDGSRTATTLEDDSTTGYEWISRSITVPNDNQTYSLSIFVKKTSGGTAPGFAVNTSLINGTAINTNQRLNTDTGVVTSASVLDFGSYWRMYWTITNNSSGNTSLRVNIYPAARLASGGGDTVTATGTATIWGMMITKGSDLLDYVPNAGKLSNVCYDISGNDHNCNMLGGISTIVDPITVFSHDGVDDIIRTSSVQDYVTNQVTVEIFVKVATHGNFNDFVRNNWVNSGWLLYARTDAWVFAIAQTGSQFSAVSAHSNSTEWTHLVGVYDGFTVKLYVNGALASQNTSAPDAAILDSNVNIDLGSSGEPGTYKTGFLKVYNRGLSTSEIKQNFEATRGRYGI